MSTVTKVTTKFGDVYIDKLIGVVDEKIRIYDSRREYLGYIESEYVYDAAYENNTTPEKVLESFIQELEASSSIENLVDLLIGDECELITSCCAVVAKHIFGYDEIPSKQERKILRQVLSNDFVNLIGDWYIVVKE